MGKDSFLGIYSSVYFLEFAMTQNDEKQNGKDFNPWRSMAIAAGAGFSMLACIGIGVWLGVSCDGYFHTSPWGLVFFSFLGGACGLCSIIKQMLEK